MQTWSSDQSPKKPRGHSRNPSRFHAIKKIFILFCHIYVCEDTYIWYYIHCLDFRRWFIYSWSETKNLSFLFRQRPRAQFHIRRTIESDFFKPRFSIFSHWEWNRPESASVSWYLHYYCKRKYIVQGALLLGAVEMCVDILDVCFLSHPTFVNGFLWEKIPNSGKYPAFLWHRLSEDFPKMRQNKTTAISSTAGPMLKVRVKRERSELR